MVTHKYEHGTDGDCVHCGGGIGDRAHRRPYGRELPEQTWHRVAPGHYRYGLWEVRHKETVGNRGYPWRISHDGWPAAEPQRTLAVAKTFVERAVEAARARDAQRSRAEKEIA